MLLEKYILNFKGLNTMKTTPYYLLFVQDFDGYFACELGSYSRKEIMDNKEYYYMNKTKVFKIDDENTLREFVYNKEKELNS